jgi:putative membrane protein
MWWYDGGWSWGSWFMPLMMVIFTVAVIVAIIYVIRALSTRGPSQDQWRQPQTREQAPATPVHGETPKEILQRRYAAGEIDRNEYLEKLKDLSP